MLIFILTIVTLLLLGIFYFIEERCQKYNESVSRENKYKQIIYVLASLAALAFSLMLYSQYERYYEFTRDLSFIRLVLNYLGIQKYYEFYLFVIFLVIVNLVSGLLFWGLKRLLSRVVAGYDYQSESAGTRALDTIAAVFYDFNYEPPYLLSNWVIVRNALRIFNEFFTCYALAILAFPYLAVSLDLNIDTSMDIANWVYHLPFITLLSLLEVHSFLGGLTESDEVGDFGFDDTSITKRSIYFDLAKKYRDVFPEHFIGELSLDSNKQNNALTAETFDDAYINTDVNDDVGKIIEKVEEKLRKNPDIQTSPYLFRMIEQLYKKKNMAVNTSIFSDAIEYFFDYLEYLIDSGNTVLIICTSKKQERDIQRFLQNQLYEKMSILTNKKVWNIKTEDELFDGMPVEILLASVQGVVDDTSLKKFGNFLDNLSTVLVIDSQNMMSRDSFLPMLMGWKLNYSTLDKKLQYIFLMEHTENEVLDAFSHAFQLGDIEFINNVRNYLGENYIELWKSEADIRMQDEWLREGARNYYGNLVTLGAFGISKGIEQVFITENSNNSYKEALENIISDGTSFDNYSRIIDQTIVGKFNETIKGQSFIVTDDFVQNLPLMLRIISRYIANRSSLVHVVSQPYLLRDFFYSKLGELNKPRYDYQMVPSINSSQQNAIFSFICEAYNHKVSEEYVKSTIGRILFPGKADVSIQTILLESLKRVKNEKDLDISSIYKSFRFSKFTEFVDGEFKEGYNIRFINDTLYREIVKNIQLVRLDILNIPEDIEIESIAVQLPQNYMEGQIITAQGKNYIIQKIDYENGVLKVMNAPFKNAVPNYIQDKTFMIDPDSFVVENKEIVENLDPGLKAFLPRFGKALVSFESIIKTNGYTVLHNGYQLGKDDHYVTHKLSDREDAYTQSLVLSYQLDSVDQTQADRIATTMSILIKEILRSLFPKLHQYLEVIPIVQTDVTAEDEMIGESIRKLYTSANYFDLEPILDESFNINIIIAEDSLINVGAVETLYNKNHLIYNIIDDYLDWFLEEAMTQSEKKPESVLMPEPLTADDEFTDDSKTGLEGESSTENVESKIKVIEHHTSRSAPFLYYGQEVLPAFFDLENTRKVAQSLSSKKEIPTEEKNLELEAITKCSFCGEPIRSVEYYEYDDGRICCQNCYKTRVTDQRELVKIYNDVRKYFYDQYNIPEKDLPKNVRVRFKSADSIRRETGMKPDPYSRVLGFAKRSTNELWIETGAPEMNIRSIIAHEMTHIWQYRNLIFTETSPTLEEMEGHASYVETEYYKYKGYDVTYSKKQLELLNRKDEYGQGYRDLLDDLSAGTITDPFELMLTLHGKGKK